MGLVIARVTAARSGGLCFRGLRDLKNVVQYQEKTVSFGFNDMRCVGIEECQLIL